MSCTAIVTGASRGIGLVIARGFLDAGWRVLALSRSACPLDAADSLAVDLADPDTDEAIGAFLGARLGPPGGQLALVHNAGMLSGDSALAIDPKRLRRVLELNVVAPARLNRLVFPRMGPGSSVLYVGSTLSEKGVPGVASYVTSKHALAGLMRATCQDLAGTGVHTVCLCPGLTETEMLRERTAGDAGLRARLTALCTMGRLVQPEEIARLVVFAAQEPALNGAMVHANLGQVEQ